MMTNTVRRNTLIWSMEDWRGGSQIWEKMLRARELIEHQILWQPRLSWSMRTTLLKGGLNIILMGLLEEAQGLAHMHFA